MDVNEIRLECLQMARGLTTYPNRPDEVIGIAARLWHFVERGYAPPAPVVTDVAYRPDLSLPPEVLSGQGEQCLAKVYASACQHGIGVAVMEDGKSTFRDYAALFPESENPAPEDPPAPHVPLGRVVGVNAYRTPEDYVTIYARCISTGPTVWTGEVVAVEGQAPYSIGQTVVVRWGGRQWEFA